MANTLTPPPTGDSPTGKPVSSKKRDSDATADGKPKRTRTGCLTCRERHLKCDESKPTCANCAKSQRDCNWGKKLNFLDTTCERNAYLIPKGLDYQIAFQDESRTIASEYVGGREMYPDEDMEDVFPTANGYNMGPPVSRHSISMQNTEPYPQLQHNFGFDQRQTQQHHHSRHSRSIVRGGFLANREQLRIIQILLPLHSPWSTPLAPHRSQLETTSKVRRRSYTCRSL